MRRHDVQIVIQSLLLLSKHEVDDGPSLHNLARIRHHSLGKGRGRLRLRGSIEPGSCDDFGQVWGRLLVHLVVLLVKHAHVIVTYLVKSTLFFDFWLLLFVLGERAETVLSNLLEMDLAMGAQVTALCKLLEADVTLVGLLTGVTAHMDFES